MLLPEAIVTTQAQIDALDDLKKRDQYQRGFREGLQYVLDLLAECEDIEVEELT